jgi:adenosylcobinamide-phosphate synthase
VRAVLFDHVALTLLALAIEAVAGYPDWFYQRIGHPAGWIGRFIAGLDGALNRDDWPASVRRAAGVAAASAIVAASLAAGTIVQDALYAVPLGTFLLAALCSALLAQRSLYNHVADVAGALDSSLEDGRAAVAKIVGRDVSELDAAGVARAAIESLGENFSDAVVAPALWLAMFGLPGALVYKAANTADSMIGHRSPRHEAFGWACARLDDLLNLPASRLSAALIAAAALTRSPKRARAAIRAVLQDAGKHASPNAGWPEAAMAGALDLRLGGPRSYRGVEMKGAWLGAGRSEADSQDINYALKIYRTAIAMFWLGLAGAAFALA